MYMFYLKTVLLEYRYSSYFKYGSKLTYFKYIQYTHFIRKRRKKTQDIYFYVKKLKEKNTFITFIGSVALSGKILLVRIDENNEIDAYLRAGQVQ